jgi:hypothetical protein
MTYWGLLRPPQKKMYHNPGWVAAPKQKKKKALTYVKYNTLKFLLSTSKINVFCLRVAKCTVYQSVCGACITLLQLLRKMIWFDEFLQGTVIKNDKN